MTRKPFISIVVAAKNAETMIGKCLDSIQKLSWPNYEVIVIDDGSLDRTGAIARSCPKVKLLRTNGVGRSQARNLGVQAAQGDFVVFTDADCMVDQNWLNALLEGFVSDDIAGHPKISS